MTAVLSALVAGGALVGAKLVREHRAAADAPSVQQSTAPPTESTSVGVRGCRTEPCRVLAITRVAGTTVELVADRGNRSGRLRIGGPSSSEVIETTVTDLGVTLTKSSLQCVAGAMSACMVRGAYEDGIAGQVVVGRSGKWSSLRKPFVSGAGYLVLAEVTGAQSGPEVIAAQHKCGRATAADCAGAPVFAQVFAVASGTEVGCTRTYSDVGSLPDHPDVTLTADELTTC